MADFKQGVDLLRDNIIITSVLEFRNRTPGSLKSCVLKRKWGETDLRDAGGLLNTASAY